MTQPRRFSRSQRTQRNLSGGEGTLATGFLWELCVNLFFNTGSRPLKFKSVDLIAQTDALDPY